MNMNCCSVPTPSGKLRLRAASVRSGGYLSEGAGDASMEPSPPTPMRKRPRAAYTVLEHQEVVDENLASLITAEYKC